MNTWRVVVLLLIVMFLAASPVWALNPADSTGPFRYGTDFLKLGYDNIGSNSASGWVFAQKEVGNRTAVLLFNSYDLNGDKKLYELGVTKQFAVKGGTLELGAFKDIWHGDEDDAGVMLDWSNHRFGIGAVLRTNGSSVFEIRGNIALKTTLYLALTEGGADPPMWGIGQSIGKMRIDLASNGDTVFLRVCQPIRGKYFPELQLKTKNNETFVGLRLGLAR